MHKLLLIILLPLMLSGCYTLQTIPPNKAAIQTHVKPGDWVQIRSQKNNVYKFTVHRVTARGVENDQGNVIPYRDIRTIKNSQKITTNKQRGKILVKAVAIGAVAAGIIILL